ncbi:variable large family protein (plasmid) [Borrelia parkeri]|uniref:variable large family protein n=1 Tax=Borrelia parkeri TaxID=141 RepID=UPI001FF2183C|nr:variable large family protein [Borrelia parkeri]UPA11402.1 variable large family protein [Borrelia parkeri]
MDFNFILFLLLSCGSGSTKTEDPKTTFLTSIANLGKGFLDVFTSLSDMITGAFGIKADTKKSDIGQYFTSIEKTMNTVKKKLQEEVAKNGNYSKIKSVVDTFITNTLDKIAEGAKTAATGATTDTVIGNATSAGHGATPASKVSVVSLVKGIKTIVDVVLKDNEGNAGATKTGEDKKDIGALFIDNTGKADAKEENIAKASASIGAVTGADILKAIAKSEVNPAADSTEGINAAEDAAGIAIAPAVANKKEIKDAAKKDAVIAAGIALRAMAKDGQFAANAEKDAHAVNGAAASAVGKTLSTLIIAIRNTVDSGLKTINKALASVTQEDKSTDSTTPEETTASGQ